MIDNFSLAVTHGLMLLAAWALLRRPDLDREGPPEPKLPRRNRRDAGDA
jgi:hypothetical protein